VFLKGVVWLYTPEDAPDAVGEGRGSRELFAGQKSPTVVIGYKYGGYLWKG